MLCYNDRTYCVSKCATKCKDKMTDKVKLEADSFGLYVSCADLKCEDYKEKK